MNPFKNKVVALLLPLVAAGAWVPRLLGQEEPQPVARPGVVQFEEDDEDSLAGLLSGGAFVLPELAPGTSVVPTAEVAGKPDGEPNGASIDSPLASPLASTAFEQSSLFDSLDAYLRTLQGRPATHRPEDLGDLLRPLRDPEPAGDPESAWTEPAPPGRLLPSALETLLASASLVGIIHGDGEPFALFGDRILRVGMELPGGVTVEEIGPTWVAFGDGREHRRAELPSFSARGIGAASSYAGMDPYGGAGAFRALPPDLGREAGAGAARAEEALPDALPLELGEQ